MNHNRKFCKDTWFWLGLLLVILGAQKVARLTTNTAIITVLAVLQVIVGSALLIRNFRNVA